MKTFPTAKEAFEFIKNGYSDLASEWEGVKDRDNVKEDDVRGTENRPRTAKDYRNGKDVTSEEFAETFGFRGGQFGNWVNQGEGRKDRQGMLNQAYDALMDLADIVGIPPKAVSLNGSLGIAFGARGSGKASAHYEPDTLVINLTKTRGAGVLAHEWFHALDNYFSHQRGGGVPMATGMSQLDYRKANYITYKPEPLYVHKTKQSTPITKATLERYASTSGTRGQPGGYYDPENWHLDPKHPEGVRPEVERRIAELVDALNASPMAQRAAMNDKAPEGYWSRIIERAARSFENYVISKMMERGYHNDYLANVREVADFPRSKERYPYLLPEEVKPIAEAFDNLFSTIETKETDSGVAMFSRGGEAPSTPISQVRAAITKAYGNLLSQLEKRGLVTVTQTQEQAIDAAAQARSDKTGESVESIKESLMESVNNSAAMRLWIGSRTVNDSIIPETEEYEGNITGDLAFIGGNKNVPSGSLRVAVGIATGPHQGFGITHMADNAGRDSRRMPQRETGNLAEDLMREAISVMSGVSSVHNDGDYIFVNNRLKKAIVTEFNNGVYSVTSVRPFNGNPESLWGKSEWNGRLAFPSRTAMDAAPSTQSSKETEPHLGRHGQEVISEKFNLTPKSEKSQPTVTIKKRRSIDVKRSADGHVQGFFDPQTGQSFLISDNLTEESAPGVLIHEAGIHMANDGTLDPIFSRAQSLIKMGKGNAFFDGVKQRLDSAGETGAEESAAYLVEAYEKDRVNAPKSVAKWVQDFIAAVRGWMHKNGILIKANDLTVADIAAIARANARSLASESSEGGLKFSKEAQVTSDAFRKWFGDSKVVDADGKPLVVYHGTGADFNVFDLSKFGLTDNGYG